MLVAFQEVRILAVIAALVASFVLGGLWFMVVVAKTYVIALGRQGLPVSKPSPLFMFGPLFCSLLMTLTSAVLLRMLHIESFEGALKFGALVGVGYVSATCLNIAINPNFPRPFLYTAINAPYFVMSSLMTCVILVVMR